MDVCGWKFSRDFCGSAIHWVKLSQWAGGVLVREPLPWKQGELRLAWVSASSVERGNASVQAWVAEEGVSLRFRAAGETLS